MNQINLYMKSDVFKYMIAPFFISLLLFCITYHVWSMDIDAPFIYSPSDDITHGALVNQAMRGHNIWLDANSGYPYGADRYAFPHVPWSAVLWGYFMGVFTQNYALVINLYYALAFCLSAVAFCYAAYKLEIDDKCAIVGGVIFAFSQFHFVHGIAHLTASSYFAVPLIVLICIYLYTDSNLKLNKYVLALSTFLIVITDTFYAFWACILLFVAGLYAFINGRKEKFYLSIKITSGIALLTGLFLLPFLVYQLSHTVNTASRSPMDTLVWSLKYIALISPVYPGHPLSHIKKICMSQGSLLSGENLCNYVGVLALAGLFFITYIGLKRCVTYNDKIEKIKALSYLNIWTLLISVTGGFGLVIAILITSKVRVYNRMSVYILCFGALGFAFLLQKLFEKYKVKNVLSIAICGCLIICHLFDTQYVSAMNLLQKKELSFSYHQKNADGYKKDKDFVKKLEGILPEHTKILYLPSDNFPEGVTETKKSNYVRGICTSFFSENFYTSYGLVYGTAEDALMKKKYGSDHKKGREHHFEDSDVKKILSYAASDAFDVILIDKRALNHPEQLCKLLEDNIHVQPMLQEDDFILYEIPDDVKAEYQGKAKNVLVFSKGFYGEEGKDRKWHWADKKAVIFCEVPRSDKGKLHFKIQGLDDANRTIKISGCGVDTVIDVANSAQDVTLDLDFSQGHELRFKSNVKSEHPKNGDSRNLNFMVSEYTLAGE